MFAILTVILSAAAISWAPTVPPQAISREAPKADTAPAERANEPPRCCMVSRIEVPPK